MPQTASGLLAIILFIIMLFVFRISTPGALTRGSSQETNDKDNNNNTPIARWTHTDGVVAGKSEDRCMWKRVKPPSSLHAFDLCLNPNDGVVSFHILNLNETYWPDCLSLLALWRQLKPVVTPLSSSKSSSSSSSAAAIPEPHGNGIFVDAGANIGSCSVLMAANRIRVVAFEPLPSNLFYLTNSLLKAQQHANASTTTATVQQQHWQGKSDDNKNSNGIYSHMHLYPIGLGASSSVHTMFAEPG